MLKFTRTVLAFMAVGFWTITMLGATSSLFIKDPVSAGLLWVMVLATMFLIYPLKIVAEAIFGPQSKEVPQLSGVELYMGMLRNLEPGTSEYSTAAKGMNYQLTGIYLDQLIQLVDHGPLKVADLISPPALDQLVAWGLARVAHPCFTVATSVGVDVANAERP